MSTRTIRREVYMSHEYLRRAEIKRQCVLKCQLDMINKLRKFGAITMAIMMFASITIISLASDRDLDFVVKAQTPADEIVLLEDEVPTDRDNTGVVTRLLTYEQLEALNEDDCIAELFDEYIPEEEEPTEIEVEEIEEPEVAKESEPVVEEEIVEVEYDEIIEEEEVDTVYYEEEEEPVVTTIAYIEEEEADYIEEYEYTGEYLTSPSGLTADDLCLSYVLNGHEQDFIDAEEKYGVRADFIAAIAALESGWGRHQFLANNVMGFGSRAFNSISECIDYVAGFLAENYLQPGGRYYNGATVAGVCVCYNGRAEWANAVTELMSIVRGE